MNFKFQKNVAIVLSSVIIGTTALSGVNVYADEITATEEDVSLNDDIFNENDIPYKELELIGISKKQIWSLDKANITALLSGKRTSLLDLSFHDNNGEEISMKGKIPNIFNIVVFPAPDAPTITQNSPFSISKFTSCNASIVTSPVLYTLLTFWKDTNAIW